MSDNIQSPMEQIEQLSEELRSHYGSGKDSEIRIAAKLMLVALNQFKQWGGPEWKKLVLEYVEIALHDPEKFEKILHSNRSNKDSKERYEH